MGLVLIYKRIEGKVFDWPKTTDGLMTINKPQLEALFEGLNWKRVTPRHKGRPIAV